MVFMEHESNYVTPLGRLKMQDLTMADQIAGVDIARPDFGRPKSQGWTMVDL